MAESVRLASEGVSEGLGVLMAAGVLFVLGGVLVLAALLVRTRPARRRARAEALRAQAAADRAAAAVLRAQAAADRAARRGDGRRTDPARTAPFPLEGDARYRMTAHLHYGADHAHDPSGWN